MSKHSSSKGQGWTLKDYLQAENEELTDNMESQNDPERKKSMRTSITRRLAGAFSILLSGVR